MLSMIILNSTIVYSKSRFELKEGQLFKDGKPFFPIGFVFGSSDEEMERAKTYGANSIHMEYSIRTLFPDSPDEVSEQGRKQIRELHERAARHDLALFPLLTGHYIPAWLRQAAGGSPVNIQGEKIGYWFEFSIHDPVFLEILEKFWVEVAKEVGDDPNTVAFVNWNEAAYGLDATHYSHKAYKNWLQQRFGKIENMNEQVGTNYESFDKVEIPSDIESNRYEWYLWVLYNQEAFANFFAWQREVIHSVAPDAKLSGKHPVMALTGDALFVNDIVLQAATQDIFGCDGYNGSLLHYRNIMEVARSLNPYGPVITYETRPQKSLTNNPKQSVLQLFAQIIGGARGMFYFCFGEEPRYGFETDSATPPAVREELTNLFCLIRDNQEIFAIPRQQAQIAVLLSNPSTIHYGTVPDPSQRDEYTKRVQQTYDLIRNQHFAVDFISERQFPDGKLMEYELLVVPSLTILENKDLHYIETFIKNGGKLLAFGESFARDEKFNSVSPPPFLGLRTRKHAPWNRGQMRLVEVLPSLEPYFKTELIVQKPEIVDPLPMEDAIPGYVPKIKVGQIGLVGNQDAYPSIIRSDDGQVIYCAFDSLYSEGLSHLIGGIIEKEFNLKREISVIGPDNLEALEVLTSMCEDGNKSVLFVGNSGPNPGQWLCQLYKNVSGSLRDIKNGDIIPVNNGAFELDLLGYEYGVYEFVEH